MQRNWKTIDARKWVLALAVLLLAGLFAGITAADSDGLLFVQQDAVTSFPNLPAGESDGVRVGTVKGEISGTVTVNFRFDLSVPPPDFAADDRALVVDPDGDQILFRVQVTGQFIPFLTDPDPTRPADFNQLSGPFIGTYEVIQATGKYSDLVGEQYLARGLGVTPAQNPDIGAVYTEVFFDEDDDSDSDSDSEDSDSDSDSEDSHSDSDSEDSDSDSDSD
ncbi:MAG: hypothetical protein AAF657_23625 [Acidobacteriota bacterium]